MPAPNWQLTNTASNAQATVTQAAPGKPMQNRLRALQILMGGTSAGAVEAVVRDGPTGTGTIIARYDLNSAANTTAIVALSGLDLRASPGNALTVETIGGGGSGTETDVNAQGDIVPVGWPYGF